jgi:surfeit locus 1 family protein
VTAAPGRSGIVGPILAALVAGAILVWLGTWQLQRLAWKEGLMRAVAERTAQPPQPPPIEADWSRLDRDAIEYRHVVVSGTFRHSDEMRVFTTLPEAKGPARGVGYWVMTPLLEDSGAVYLINRGFVPQDKADPATRPEGQVQGRVEIAGLLRWSEDRNLFTPSDKPAEGVWFTRDTAAMAQAKGLAHVAPFFIDAETSPPGGLPQGGETRLVFSNRHLEYALTWYGLAIALVGVTFAFVRRRLKAVAG